ncbi:MAG: hypothetical protein WD648_14015 [Planctomycetaceae bacterium]
MLHFSCDLCGQHLGDRRFAVKLEVFAAFDPEEIDEQDLDADNLQNISAMIEEMEQTGETPVDDCSPKKFRFDLCPHCHQRFLQDPLGREATKRLNFSKN